MDVHFSCHRNPNDCNRVYNLTIPEEEFNDLETTKGAYTSKISLSIY